MNLGYKPISIQLTGLLLFFLLLFYAIYKQIPEQILKNAKILPFGRTWNSETEKFKMYPQKDSLIIMFGNSITAGIDWAELMQRNDIVNRGIPGDDTHRMNIRFEELCKQKPKLIAIMAGINDLIQFERKPAEIMLNYGQLLEKAQQNHVKVLVFSTLYMYQVKAVNRQVTALNTELEKYCKSKHIPYIDLNLVLSENHSLKLEHSADGLHLTAVAYKKWGTEFANWLKLNNL